MERHDVSENGSWAELIAKAESGEPVEFTRDGAVVAELKAPTKMVPIFDPEKLKALHERMAPLTGGDAIGLVREMRDARDF